MKIITSGLLNKFPEIIFGISTRFTEEGNPPFYFNLSYRVGDNAAHVKRNRKKFFDKLGINENSVSYQRQTHSVNSNYITNPLFCENSDALYTDKKENFLAVSIADCIPVFIYEPQKKVVAAIHSGWKGTLNKITTVTIDKLINEFSIDIRKTLAFIGPGISVVNFEVGKDVSDLFDGNVKMKLNGKYFIDLKKHNYLQLVNLGFDERNIEVSDFCTYKEKDLFHSYRRDKDKSGRMLGVIGII
jgi:polyphenol oxidase